MILKSQVEWSLHCCVLLAGLPPEKYLATKDLAEYHGLPKEYLSKALQSLSQAKLVISTMGPTGGYRLARPAEEITFLDIVEAVEGKRSTFNCTEIRQNNPCRLSDQCDDKPCGIASVMWEADEAWRNKLRSVRLADVIAQYVSETPVELMQRSTSWVLERV